MNYAPSSFCTWLIIGSGNILSRCSAPPTKRALPRQTLGLEHNYFGTMNGKDGKPFKTREGGVMKLKDLIALVHEAALQRMDESNVATEFAAEERQAVANMVGLGSTKICRFDEPTHQRLHLRFGSVLVV